MHAVDSNVLVRLIARDDLLQTETATRFIANGVWVSILVLAETVWVLKSIYGLPPAELIAGIEMLQNERELTFQDPEVVAAALDLFRARPALGFSDCLILQVARKAGHLPLGTFDRALSSVEGVQKL